MAYGICLAKMGMNPAYMAPIPSVVNILVKPETRPLAYYHQRAASAYGNETYVTVRDQSNSSCLQGGQEDISKESVISSVPGFS